MCSPYRQKSWDNEGSSAAYKSDRTARCIGVLTFNMLPVSRAEPPSLKCRTRCQHTKIVERYLCLSFLQFRFRKLNAKRGLRCSKAASDGSLGETNYTSCEGWSRVRHRLFWKVCMKMHDRLYYDIISFDECDMFANQLNGCVEELSNFTYLVFAGIAFLGSACLDLSL